MFGDRKKNLEEGCLWAIIEQMKECETDIAFFGIYGDEMKLRMHDWTKEEFDKSPWVELDLTKLDVTELEQFHKAYGTVYIERQLLISSVEDLERYIIYGNDLKENATYNVYLYEGKWKTTHVYKNKILKEVAMDLEESDNE